MHTLSDPGTDSRYVALKVQLKAWGNLFETTRPIKAGGTTEQVSQKLGPGIVCSPCPQQGKV